MTSIRSHLRLGQGKERWSKSLEKGEKGIGSDRVPTGPNWGPEGSQVCFFGFRDLNCEWR